MSKKQDRANSDDVDVVVTMRVTDAGVVVPGSVERTCAMCDAAVWVSPSTLAVFDGRTMPPIWCTPCALTFSRRGGRALLGRITGDNIRRNDQRHAEAAVAFEKQRKGRR